MRRLPLRVAWPLSAAGPGMLLAATLALWPACASAQSLVQGRLEVPGYCDASYVRPRRSAPRPVVVLLHSAADRPEWMCKHWGPVVGRRGWMLCPRGVRRTDVPAEKDRWTHGSKAATLAEIRAGLAALRRRFGGRVDTGGEQVLAGFSKGASLASTLALSHPREFPLVWIHEGGAWAWTASRARRFHAGGGRALVISCGKESCARRARRGCAAARGVGLICHMLYVPGLGHSVERPFSAHAAPLFERLVARDPRWERPGTRKAGGPCTTGAQCQSGICEGPGCGPQQGRCAPRKRSCGKRLQTVCGCDLQNHRVHRGCPGIRYRGAHPCDAADR